MKTAVIYARYSSNNQTEQSIEGQIRVCKDYAERNGITVIHTYVDRAMTGTNDNREEFQQMLKDSEQHRWEHILVYKLDRFSRNKYEMAIHRKHLKDNGVKILSAMENIPDSPEGLLLESLLEGMNQYFSEELSQKTKRGLNESRLKGNYTGGKVAYGYKLENQKLVIDEDEAQVVRDVFTFYAGGMKLVDIVKNLNDRNIKYRNSPFTTHCLYSMLRKETYTGIYTVDGKTYDNIYPQIITKELFDTVHKRTSANKYGKHTDVTYLLKGLLFCGYCGDKLASYTGTSRSGKLSRYYRCVTANKGKELCECKLMRKERIEELVVETLKNLITNNEDVELIAKAVVKVHNEKIKVNTNLDNFERELAATKKSIANIMTAIEAGIFTETTRERLQELEILKRDLENKIFDEKSKTVVEYTEQQVIDYIKSGKTKNDEQLINLLVGRVSLYNERVVITIKGSATDTTPNDDDRKSYIKYYGEGKTQINNNKSPERKENSDQGFSITSNYVFKNNQKQINRGPKTKYKSYSVSIGI